MKQISLYILLLAYVSIFNSCEKDSGPGTYDKEIFDQFNNYRTSIGLPPLESNDYMWQLANEHSTAMANGSIPIGHDGSTERYSNIRVELGNGNYSENIDWGTGTADEVVARWLKSVGHKGNIESNFTHTAISAVKGNDGKYYYTQLFYKID
jgi:uncharacterized protein YkwD